MAEFEETENVGENVSQAIGQDINALKNDLNQLRQDVATLTETLKKVVEGGAEVGRAKAFEELEHLYGQFQQGYESLQREGRRARTGLEKEIEDRPFTALAGAFIVGIVLGKIMSAR